MSTATAPATSRRLYRSTRDSRLGGVCGGIAEVYGWDPTTVRLVAALSLLLPGPQALAYIIAWAIMPTDATVFGWTQQAAQYTPADAADTPDAHPTGRTRPRVRRTTSPPEHPIPEARHPEAGLFSCPGRRPITASPATSRRRQGGARGRRPWPRRSWRSPTSC